MPDWNSESPRGAPMVTVPWTGPYYPPSAAGQGKKPSEPSDVFIALKRVCGHLGCWPWDPDGYDRSFSDDFAHGSARGPGIAGLQKWAKIQPTGFVGESTWNFCRSVLIQSWKTHAGEHAFDSYSVDLCKNAAKDPPPPATNPRDLLAAHFEQRDGYTEQPPESNCDDRSDGIRTAQDKTAQGSTWLRGEPWCGCWCYYALDAVGVTGMNSWMASVASIEDRARDQLSPFKGWTTDRSKVKVGDLVVVGGRGVHVETVRGFSGSNTLTWGGNTSSGSSGSQSNGGGAYKRSRYPSEVYGYALVRYPGE
jgi:hypothetical protein